MPGRHTLDTAWCTEYVVLHTQPAEDNMRGKYPYNAFQAADFFTENPQSKRGTEYAALSRSPANFKSDSHTPVEG